jgi:prevent-host-death family protein
MEVGVRELKAKLSEYVGRAAAGESVIVTDRGRPVARLTGLDTTAPLTRGIDEGWIEAPRRTNLSQVQRHHAEASVLSVLDSDRGA